jgi:hypothetical protein
MHAEDHGVDGLPRQLALRVAEVCTVRDLRSRRDPPDQFRNQPASIGSCSIKRILSGRDASSLGDGIIVVLRSRLWVDALAFQQVVNES